MERTQIVAFLTLLGVATQLLRSAHCLIMVVTCAKLFQNIFSSLKVMERTRNVDFLTLNLQV
jgi:hypothetical protein